MRLPFFVAVALVACHPADGDPSLPGLPDPVCGAAAPWTPGDRVFRDVSAAWGLAGVTGVRLVAVDFDSDGWTDLSVTRPGLAGDDFADGGARTTWLLRNNHGTFVDVTRSSGLRTRRDGDAAKGRPGEVVAFGDVDGDGDLDAFTGLYDAGDAAPDQRSELMINQGDGTFTLGEASGLGGAEDATPSSAAFVDFDRDGALDLWLPQGDARQDQLYRGDGAGHFTAVTASVGLTTVPWSLVSDVNAARAHSNAWSGAACDVNGDGRPDLLAASYGRAPNHLWLQQADGTFANTSIASGYAFDTNQDWSDNESARCWCTLHPADAGCDGVPPPEHIACTTDADAFRWRHGSDREPYRLGGNSGTTVCADVDSDGDIDLLTTEIVHWDVGASSDASELLINDGAGTFSRPGNPTTGLVRTHDGVDWNDGDMTAAVFDFDLDGRPDVWIGSSDYPGDRGLLWHQTAAGTFEPVPPRDGADHPRSHGVAVADFDRDGDLDLVAGHSSGRCADDCPDDFSVQLWENQLRGNFVQVALEGGDVTNRAAIGARLTVATGGLTQTHEVGGGHGHYGIQHDLVQTFGLGEACEATVTVRWPDAAATEETVTLPAGHRFRWAQGEAPVVVEPAP